MKAYTDGELEAYNGIIVECSDTGLEIDLGKVLLEMFHRGFNIPMDMCLDPRKVTWISDDPLLERDYDYHGPTWEVEGFRSQYCKFDQGDPLKPEGCD